MDRTPASRRAGRAAGGFALLVALAPESATACDRPTPLDAWRAEVAAAESAWLNLHLEDFRSATDAAAALLPCLAAVVSLDDAARAHRLAGLRADVLGDADRAAAAFLAARRLDPEWRFPESLPAEHPLRLLYARRPLDGLYPSPLPRPRAGTVVVDGEVTRTRLEGLPALVQWQAPDGSIGWSGYLQPDESAVSYPQAPTRTSTVLTLASVSAVSAVVAGVSWAVAADARQHYDDLSTPPGDLPGLRDTTNTGFWLSVGAGAGAATALVAAVVVLRL